VVPDRLLYAAASGEMDLAGVIRSRGIRDAEYSDKLDVKPAGGT